MSRSRNEIADAQGWNNETLLSLALAFINEAGLAGEFAASLEEVASDENLDAEPNPCGNCGGDLEELGAEPDYSGNEATK